MDASTGATLKRPVRVVKKRSGPLEDALAALNQETATAITTSSATVPITTPVATRAKSGGTVSPPSGRRRPTIKEKEKKRERWLLTRKTWKYMTDAGRKLIPESAQNRREDIPKIEAHFQQICAAEPRFILWRRKSSYPGAMRNSKRRLKQLLQHTGLKAPLSHDAIAQDEAHNADQVIDLLQSYLKLDEACKTTTLLGSKTVRPDQTASPSAQRPAGPQSGVTSSSSGLKVSMRGPGFMVPQPHASSDKRLQQLSEIEQLLERLRTLSRSTSIRAITIPPECITPALLEDKAALKKIYNALKKQQLHRILSHSAPHTSTTNLKHSTSLSSLLHFGGGGSGSSVSGHTRQHQHHHHTQSKPNDESAAAAGAKVQLRSVPASDCSSGYPMPVPRQRNPPSTLDLASHGGGGKIPVIAVKVPPPQIERQFNSCGTQTNFVPLHEIKRLAEEYKERKREEAAASGTSAGGTPGATDDEAERNATSGGYHHRRKSSIDNEDVSQSVSDTIKRYLRMARKKSVHEDSANRFKRVNYDRNLRNIRAKGEINPPGMDEGNSKAIQTLDAWPLITLDFIRGNENSGVLEAAHTEWRKALDERLEKKREYDQKMASNSAPTMATKQSVSSCSSSSAPTSPTSEQYGGGERTQSYGGGGTSTPTNQTSGGGGGLRLPGSQFFSQLLHGGGGGGNGSSDATQIDGHGGHNFGHLLSFHKGHKTDTAGGGGSNNNASKNVNSSAMQKSKSSSNVGQFVSRKILRNRSKSQTRPAIQAPLSKWAPSDKFTWTSDNGECVRILDAFLQNLTDIEAKILQRVAIEKISELNIGINVSLDMESKSQKRRTLPKKKAMTTSFFDIGKKDDQSNNLNLFGNTLEGCMANDRKRYLKTATERGSRNSIASLLRSAADASVSKLNEQVRSYESLPTSTLSLTTSGAPNEASGGAELGRSGSTSKASHYGYLSNLAKSASMQISRSQSDVRRKSQELELASFELQAAATPLIKELHEMNNSELQVPSFVTSCIKYLEENGLHKVGLFRVSTSKKRVKQMREDFDKNAITQISEDTCPHDVATLLKEFLRDLPEPLLCGGLYKAFLETQKIRNRRLQLEAISHLVKLLPAAHRDTLYVLLRFLAKVAACSDDVTSGDGNVQVSGNKMDSNNLATVFAPNILRNNLKPNNGGHPSVSGTSASGEQESMSDAINVIRTMIDHYEEIFKVPAELIDIVYSHMLDTCPEKLYFLCEQRSALGKEELGTSCSSLSSPEQVTSPTSSSPTPPTVISLNSPSASGTPKRLYKRESVMHDNDASRVSSPAVMNGGKRHHSDTHSSRSSSGGSGYSGMAGAQSSRAQRHDTNDRRQSTPNLQDQKTGVVSVSLQIPVKAEQSTSELDDVFYHSYVTTPVSSSSAGGFDSGQYADIPYIEDATSAQDLEIISECFPVSGTLSFTPKLDFGLKEKPQSQSQTQMQPQPPPRRGSSSARGSASSVESGTSIKKKATPNEPKLPASISNIGGAILRSKTADFERMSLMQEQQQQQQQLSPQQQQPKANSKNTKTRTNAKPGGNTTTTIRTHLYKRQELIPSAKHLTGQK